MAALVVRTDVVAGRPVRSWSAGRVAALPPVVFVPGLGAPGYLLRWARAVGEWTSSTVLDLPGWRWGRARACLPTLDGVATGVTAWLAAHPAGPVVLVGHSTGAQAVIRAAVRDPGAVCGVVLVGPTFATEVRTGRAVVRRAATTLPRERPGEIPAVLGSYLHSGGRPLLRFLRDGLADRPELTVPRLTTPVLVLTGRHDGFAPPAWGAELASLVEPSGAPHVTLAGAHNFVFPHAARADTVLHEAVTGWSARDRPSDA